LTRNVNGLAEKTAVNKKQHLGWVSENGALTPEMQNKCHFPESRKTRVQIQGIWQSASERACWGVEEPHRSL